MARALIDADGFEPIYERYYSEVGTFLRRMLVPEHMVAEAAHETLVQAWQGLRRLREPAALRGWLFGIATRLVRSELRRQRRRGLSFPALARTVSDCVGAGSLQRYDSQEVASALRVFAKLSPEHREVMLLNAVYGHSAPEIGAALGLRTGTVKSRLARAHRQLEAHTRSREDGA